MVVSAETILGPVGLMGSPTDKGDDRDEEEEESDDESAALEASARLIDLAPLATDTTIDEPVTSGNDRPND